MKQGTSRFNRSISHLLEEARRVVHTEGQVDEGALATLVSTIPVEGPEAVALLWNYLNQHLDHATLCNVDRCALNRVLFIEAMRQLYHHETSKRYHYDPSHYLGGADLRSADLRGFQPTANQMQRIALFGMQLQRCNFSQTNLRSAGLNKSDLRGANLQGADLQHASLEQVNLQTADLRGANLKKAWLGAADLRGARLEGASLEYCFFDSNTRWPEGFDWASAGCLGPGAVFPHADLRDTRLSSYYNSQELSLQRAILTQSRCKGAWFTDVDLRYADLRGADLREVSFLDCNLRGVDLRESNLLDARFERVRIDDETRWPAGFVVAGHNVIGPRQNLRHSGFDQEPTVLTNACLKECDLRNSDCYGTSFAGSNLQDARLDESDLRVCSFNEANMAGATLDGASLERSDLKFAINLHQASLVGVSYDHATQWPDGFDPQAYGAELWVED